MSGEVKEENKIVIITGAFRGIGNMIFRHLQKSFIVWPICRTLSQKRRLEEHYQHAHPETLVFHGDLRMPATVQKIANMCKKKNVSPYAVIHCSGPITYTSCSIPEWNIWEKQTEDNLAPSIHLIKTLSERMKSGRIVMFAFSGVDTHRGFKNIAAYAAAKESVVVLARAAAKKLADKGITVNVIAPGVFLTETGKIPAYGKTMLPSIPANRFGTSEDICGVVDWLLSDESAYVTGQIIKVSGGLHI